MISQHRRGRHELIKGEELHEAGGEEDKGEKNLNDPECDFHEMIFFEIWKAAGGRNFPPKLIGFTFVLL